MLVSYLESLKYMGHMFPVALLRIYLGWTFLWSAWVRYNGDFLKLPGGITDSIKEWAPASSAPEWYKDFLYNQVTSYWPIFAYCVIYFGFLVGCSLLLGFFVRPVALLAAIFSINFIYTSGPETLDLYALYLILFLMMAWIGAGRCLGLDYYFYKRDRGLWW